MQVRAQNPSENPGLLATAAIGVGAAVLGAAAGATAGACAPRPTGYVRRPLPCDPGLGDCDGYVEVFTSTNPCAPVGQGQEARVIVNTGEGVPPLVFGPERFANPMEMLAWINEAAGFDVTVGPEENPGGPVPGGPLGIRRGRASNPCSTCGLGVPPNPAGNASSRERRAWAMSQIGTPMANPMANPCDGICPECGVEHNPRPLTPQEASHVRGGTFRNPAKCYPGSQPCESGSSCQYIYKGHPMWGCTPSSESPSRLSGTPAPPPDPYSAGPSYATAMLMQASPMASRKQRRATKHALALRGQVATPERVRFGR